MKQIILILVLNLIYVFISLSQCDNNVNTDYNNTPTNDALPTNPPQPDYGEHFLNQFNWVPRTSNLTLAKYQTINMSADLLDDGEIENIFSDQQISHYSYIYDYLEPNPQNGWELISVNMGFFPDTTVQQPTSSYTSFPYLILYNKYKSILRIAGILGPGYETFGTSIDAVVVRLDLDDSPNLSGILRLSEGLDRTLDQNTIISQAASVTRHPNQKAKFFSTDFQIAYDPCVCFYDSRMRFTFDFIETALDFSAQINSISLVDDLVDDITGLKDVDFLNNFNYSESGVDKYEASNGYLIYHAMDDLLDYYIAELQHYEDSLPNIYKHNEQVKRRKWIVKAGKYVLKAGTLALTGGSSAVLDLKTFLPLVAPDLMDGEDKLRDNILKEVQKLLGLGTEFLISEWVGEEIEESDFPSKPAQPSATFTQSTMRGTITRTIEDFEGPRLRTPGTYGGNFVGANDPINTPQEYPVYNEALGVFALLKEPKLKGSKSIENKNCEVLGTVGEHPITGDPIELFRLEYDYVRQLKIDGALNYILNPALNIKNHSIDVSYVVKGNVINSDSIYQVVNSPKESVNIESISFNPDEKDTLGIESTINSIYIPVDALNNFVFSVGHNRVREVTSHQNFCGSDYVYDIEDNILTENDKAFNFDEVYLKLLINVTYEGEKSDGSPHEYTYMFTYKIDEDDIDWDLENPIYPNLPGSASNISQYPENLSLNGEAFNGSQVDGCKLNGNTYLCKAWNDVELSGEFTVANNFEVIVEAGNEINVFPESVTPPEMIWQIAPVLDFSSPMPPASAAYVQNFCQDENLYKARAGMITNTDTDSPLPTEESVADNFAFNVFPNPTGGRTTVGIVLNDAAVGELFITDINGRKLGSAFENQRLSEGKSEHQLPTENLASGIYLVHLFVDGQHHVKRLVKN